MHKNAPLPLRLSAVAAVLFLSACDSGSQQAAPPPPSNDAAMAEDAPVTNAAVVLPPSLAASRTYRCKDNSLVYVDFYSDNVTADLKTDKDGAVTKLTAPEAGKPLTGGGFTVSGNETTTTITQPGKGSQSCTA